MRFALLLPDSSVQLDALSGISGYHIQMFRCHRQTAASGCEILVGTTGEAFDLSFGSPGTEITLIKRLQNQLTGPLGGST